MTENVEKIFRLIHEDCRQTIHELADAIGIGYEVCQEISTEILNRLLHHDSALAYMSLKNPEL
jgi:DNA-binding Lrp family transcriptional regulator